MAPSASLARASGAADPHKTMLPLRLALLSALASTASTQDDEDMGGMMGGMEGMMGGGMEGVSSLDGA